MNEDPIKRLHAQLKAEERRLEAVAEALQDIRLEIDEVIAEQVEQRNDAIAAEAEQLAIAMLGDDADIKRFGLLETLGVLTRMIDALPLDVRLKLTVAGRGD